MVALRLITLLFVLGFVSTACNEVDGTGAPASDAAPSADTPEADADLKAGAGSKKTE